MTGNQLFMLRHRSGLTRIQFGRAMGYRGNDSTIARKLRRFERMFNDLLPPPVAIAAHNARWGVNGKPVETDAEAIDTTRRPGAKDDAS